MRVILAPAPCRFLTIAGKTGAGKVERELHMKVRLRSLGDVRAFTIVATAAVLLGNLGLQGLLLPPGIAAEIRFAGTVVALALAAPAAFLVGLKLRDAHGVALDLEHASRHDPLTGAITRRSFFERAAHLGPGPMTVIVADVDHFKRINDRFGNLAGDRALREVAATLMRNCRTGDMVARFGGEEFLVLLPGTRPEDGAGVARRLCERLREKALAIGDETVRITASFGVAGIGGAAELDGGIARADAALYEAKCSGRDRVCVAG